MKIECQSVYQEIAFHLNKEKGLDPNFRASFSNKKKISPGKREYDLLMQEKVVDNKVVSIFVDLLVEVHTKSTEEDEQQLSEYLKQYPIARMYNEIIKQVRANIKRFKKNLLDERIIMLVMETREIEVVKLGMVHQFLLM